MMILFLRYPILKPLIFVATLVLLCFSYTTHTIADHVEEVDEGLVEDAIPDEFIIPELVNFELCTATILNRSSQLNPDGTFSVSNIPVPVGATRVRIICEPGSGLEAGQSPFLFGVPNGVSQFGSISFNEVQAIPVSLDIGSPATVLTPTANGAQLVTTGTLADGTQIDLTLADTGTSYLASNLAIATVSPDGFVNAVSSGNVLITGNSGDTIPNS